MTSLGIDYGGTLTKLLLRDGSGGVLARESVDTSALPSLAGHVRRFLSSAQARPTAFGVTVAGTLDAETGIVGRSANLPWLDGTAPADELQELLGIPGRAVRDGEAAAIAEACDGAGSTRDDVFVIVLGTGIAGSHVVAGRVRHGAHGGAGEIGHMRATDAEHPCSCGQRGCLETLIGGSQLGVRWHERAGAAPSRASAREVVEAARAGDRAAVETLDAAADGLARALLHLSALVDPALIVIGGGVARASEWTVRPAIVRARALATFHTVPEIVPAGLGVWAGAHGAALAALG